MGRWWQVWSWPSPGGHGHPRHPDDWERPGPGEAQKHPFHYSPTISRTPYPAGARPSKWYTSRVPVERGGQLANRFGGSALKQRFPDLPPKVVRPAFTGPYERKFARTCIGRNRAIYQPLQMLPVIKRSQPQAVRHSQTPRLRPALVAPRQRYSRVKDEDILSRARSKAFGTAGGAGRLGTRGA